MGSKKIFILIPSHSPTGPVKGAYALANEWVTGCEVTIVNIKQGVGAGTFLDDRVGKVSLVETAKGFYDKTRLYQSILKSAGNRKDVISVSFCFSADVINAFCSKLAITCSSVRGNLMANYRLDYGFLGLGLAAFHLSLLRFFDLVVAMNRHMADQIEKFSGKKAEIVGNFVDEKFLESYRAETPKSEKPLSFVFVGSLSKRKQPWLILDAVAKLRESRIDAVVHFVGSGSGFEKLRSSILKLRLEESAFLHGFMKSPYELLAQADAMVLPSLSEGTSRAALEALCLGVPCVLRDVDGNSDLIQDGVNGALFSDDGDLPEAMIRAAQISRKLSPQGFRPNLLPNFYRRDVAANKILRTLNTIL